MNSSQQLFDVALSDVKNKMRDLSRDGDYSMSLQGAVDAIGPDASEKDLKSLTKWSAWSGIFEAAEKYHDRPMELKDVPRAGNLSGF